MSQWGGAIDRFFVGIDLLDAGKAPLIIFTRAQWPWLNLPPEGEILAKRALTMGVSSNQILLTGTVTTTADEANEIKTLMELAGMERVILVTSAYHMPRAKMLFDRAGINSIPHPTDFKSSGGHLDWMSFVPSGGGLVQDLQRCSGILLDGSHYRAKFCLNPDRIGHSQQTR